MTNSSEKMLVYATKSPYGALISELRTATVEFDWATPCRLIEPYKDGVTLFSFTDDWDDLYLDTRGSEIERPAPRTRP